MHDVRFCQTKQQIASVPSWPVHWCSAHVHLDTEQCLLSGFEHEHCLLQQEQLEARLTQKRSEVKSLNAKLETAQRQLSQHSAGAELANQQAALALAQAQTQIAAYDTQHLQPGHVQACLCISVKASYLSVVTSVP